METKTLEKTPWSTISFPENYSKEIKQIDDLLLRLHPIKEKTITNEVTGDSSDSNNFDPALYQKNDSVIRENEYVLIELPSRGSKLVELKKDKIISLGKFGNFKVDQILGYKFGTTFEIKDKDNVAPVDSDKFLNNQELLLNGNEEEEEEKEENVEVELGDKEKNKVKEDEIITDEITNLKVESNKEKESIIKSLIEHSEDNSNLIDIGSKIQLLSTEEIELMKKQSYSLETGKKIIEEIINRHGNFDKKTKFSQQKYLKRKKEKFSRYFVVKYLSAKELLKFYIENKDIRKSLDISEESVAYMLNLGNVRPGGKYLIMDESLGLFTYFMLERMNGKGEIIILTENQFPNIIALERYSNYPKNYIKKMVKSINLLQFITPLQDTLDNDDTCCCFKEVTTEEYLALSKQQKLSQTRKFYNYVNLLNVLRTCYEGNFDGLFLITTLNIPSILKFVLHRVGGSRSVLIYSQFKELLLDTYSYIQQENIPILAPSLFEIKARAYQAVLGKLHPVMTCRGGGGYVLYGLRVFPLESVQAIGKNKRRKKQSVETSTERKGELEAETLSEPTIQKNE